MTWSIRYDDSVAIILISYESTLTAQDIEDSAGEALMLSKRHGCRRILADCLTLRNANPMSTIYMLADSIASEPAFATMREALILPESPLAKEAVHFWEKACTNRGLAVRSFAGREDAMAWLMK